MRKVQKEDVVTVNVGNDLRGVEMLNPSQEMIYRSKGSTTVCLTKPSDKDTLVNGD